MARLSLRSGLERDVYQIVTKLETADGSSLTSVSAVYDAIKQSNSSLGRLKKRPLQDAIDRVLQIRKRQESDDSEAAIDNSIQPPTESSDTGFLLNRQMTKHWKLDSGQPPVAKRRRIDVEKEADNTPDGGPGSAMAQQEKPQQSKKMQRSSRHHVEQPIEPVTMAGIDDLYRLLLDHCRMCLRISRDFRHRGLEQSSGILISGPSGVGKMTLVKNVAAALRVPLISVAGCFLDPERLERSLSEAFDTALSMAPSIVLIRRLDRCLPKAGSPTHSDHYARASAYFEKQMERLSTSGQQDRVLAMATTSMITDIDPAMLKLGIFEETYQLKVPDSAARLAMLQALTANIDLADDVDLGQIAALAHGYVASDLVAIKKRAAKSVLQRLAGCGGKMQQGQPSDAALLAEDIETGDKYEPMTLNDLKEAVRNYTPSLRKEGFTVIPSVTWDQVGALENVRRQLQRSIIGPIKQPELYRTWHLTHPAGVVLWGPPGCGKTLVAQAVANEAQASFIVVNGPEILNKYVGESERAVRELFERARSAAPCIIFFDEFDSVVPPRGSTSTDSGARIVNALLTELDGAQGRDGVHVIATTNRPDLIDGAILRPGRLSMQLLIDIPTPAERVEILRAIYRKFRGAAAVQTVEYKEVLAGVALDGRCNGFSGADLGNLHTKACEHGLGRCEAAAAAGVDALERVTRDDWEYALDNTRPSVKHPESYRLRCFN
ncbi:hypothetical protein CDD81_6749 [Ophiocordyceps australis]|uniref:Peroxisomal ATPase PEX1 n=1 Tax=Ophiocordyceps australis TaxID=1399860 RepID=A0A2C5Y7B7_9HYPO|nr:hypothetical protein CDD81_6749 [Ophiocordyceps australis]